MVELTEVGREKCELYIKELNAKRKELLDAGKDTANETEIPTVEDIRDEIEWFEEDDEYLNNWGVTDNYEGDYPIDLKYGCDYYRVGI